MDKLIREDYVLGNKKIVVGDNLHDLVLENLGKIWVRYGNGYKEFSQFISTLAKSTVDKSKVVIETNGTQPAEAYKDGQLIFDAKKKNLYLKYQDALLLLLEYNDGVNEKYVYKTGDTMTGPLTIDVKRGAPLIVKSSTLVQNLNAEYLYGHPIEDLAQKAKDETIDGNWTANGNWETNGNWVNNGGNIHNGQNTFNNQVTINGPLKENSTSEFLGKATFKDEIEVNGLATFKKSGVAMRVGTGDIITDGSIGSSQFMSGMTGYGWRLDADTNTLTIDNLIVRGVLNVFELVVNKISATNGSFWITDSFKVDKVHNIKYLKAEDYPITNESQYNELLGMFNEDDYYVIYSNSFNKTVVDLTENTQHPFAQRSNQEPTVDTKVFDKFKYIFKITNLESFKELFAPEVSYETQITEVELKLNEIVNILVSQGFQLTEGPDNLICFKNVSRGITPLYDLANQLHTGEEVGYILFAPESNKLFLISDDVETSTIEDNAKLLSVDDLETLSFIINTKTTITTVDYSSDLNIFCNRNYLCNLCDNEIISLANMFQKHPENVLDLEIVSPNVFISPDDTQQKFEEQYFTIVDASQATLNNGKYLYDAEALSTINLYCKYFASNLANEMRTFVLEAKHDEFPVFRAGDILKCQKFTGNSIKQYHALVLGLANDYSYIVQLQNTSVVQEGIKYSYDLEGNLVESDSNLDRTLYDRAPGLQADLSEYLSQAREFLNQYDQDSTSVTSQNLHWAIQVLFPEDQVADLEAGIIAGTVDIPEAIATYGIEGLSYEECLEHPIFKKAFENATTSAPEKDDALVRVGSIMFSDRRNSMYLTSSEQNSPYTDVLVGVNRPDYTVIYLTPKYVRFEASQNIDGEVRKGIYYVQDNAFSTAIKNIQNGNVNAVSQELRALYAKYSAFITNIQGTSDPNAEIRSVVLTFLPNDNTAYDIEGNPIMQTVSGQSYFVSSNLEDGIINGETSLNIQDSDKCSNYKIDEETTITLLIGGE